MSSAIRVRVLETERYVCLLGIRFWDPARSERVRDGLRVSARRPGDGSRTWAASTRSGIYAFHRVPGRSPAEQVSWPLEGSPSDGSPPDRQDYVVEVVDDRSRFLPVAFRVSVPLESPGTYPVESTASGILSDGVPLYSSVMRQTPPCTAVVRGELRNTESDGPAEHAIVIVRDPQGTEWIGLSDEAGRFVVHLPYPTLPDVPESPPSPPAAGGGNRLLASEWTLSLSVRYQPSAQVPLAGAGVPDLLSLTEQSEATLWREEDTSSSGTAAIDVQLSYGHESVVRTADQSRLWLSADGSPP